MSAASLLHTDSLDSLPEACLHVHAKANINTPETRLHVQPGQNCLSDIVGLHSIGGVSEAKLEVKRIKPIQAAQHLHKDYRQKMAKVSVIVNGCPRMSQASRACRKITCPRFVAVSCNIALPREQEDRITKRWLKFKCNELQSYLQAETHY